MSNDTGVPTAVAERYPQFTDQLRSYHDFLAAEGVEWGLIGPREVPRLWERHILNCAVVADIAEGLVPQGSTVIDVGTGAGLPGIVWAIVRPDLRVTLLEPLERRTRFLTLVVDELGLADRVDVVRGRAQDADAELQADVVTARAVARLPKLIAMLLPLAKPTGVVVALKGESAATEIAESADELTRVGAQSVELRLCGEDVLSPPTTVVVVTGASTGRTGGTPRGKNRRRR